MKDEAERNMFSMLLALSRLQSPNGWLNALAMRNILSKLTTLLTLQAPMGWLKDEAPLVSKNIEFIVVALEVSHAPIG